MAHDEVCSSRGRGGGKERLSNRNPTSYVALSCLRLELLLAVGVDVGNCTSPGRRDFLDRSTMGILEHFFFKIMQHLRDSRLNGRCGALTAGSFVCSAEESSATHPLKLRFSLFFGIYSHLLKTNRLGRVNNL